MDGHHKWRDRQTDRQTDEVLKTEGQKDNTTSLGHTGRKKYREKLCSLIQTKKVEKTPKKFWFWAT